MLWVLKEPSHSIWCRGFIRDCGISLVLHTSTKLLLYLATTNLKLRLSCVCKGAQWLSGRVLDSRPKGSGFEPHQRHCVVVLEQDTFILA